MCRSKFKVAGQAEILRAAQKDENYIHQLNEVISNLALNFGGKSFWLNYASYHIIVSKLMYYGSTSLCNLQSLGEEYTGIIPMQNSLQKLLTFKKMLLYVALLSGGHTFMDKMITCAEKMALPENMKPHAGETSPPFPQNAVRIFRHLLPYLERLNKSIFYWNGRYYSFVNRLLGVKHVLIQCWLKDEASLYGFKILAVVSFINVIVSLVHSYPMWLNHNTNNMTLSSSVEDDSMVTTRNICRLCLNGRKNTSITPCGHLFCWTCIMKWLQIRKDCPMCKNVVIPSRITFLMNYDKCA